MPIYNFNSGERLTTMDSIPDFRSDAEREESPLSLYNHDKPDIAYAERMAEELINLSGAVVTVFLKEPKGDTEDMEVWDEDADPMYRNGVQLKAYIKPENIAIELTKWGLDVPLNMDIVFHRSTIISTFGKRLLAVGDVIRVPYNAAKALMSEPKRDFDFRILNVYDSGNFQYRWLYYTAKSQLITGDEALKVRTN